jgi:hypothetical protein
MVFLKAFILQGYNGNVRDEVSTGAPISQRSLNSCPSHVFPFNSLLLRVYLVPKGLINGSITRVHTYSTE